VLPILGETKGKFLNKPGPTQFFSFQNKIISKKFFLKIDCQKKE
jgi:hypothetical protein